MQGVDPEQAVLYNLQEILRRLRPLVDDIVARELMHHSPHSEASELNDALSHSLERMEGNLSKLGFSSESHT